MSRPDTISLLLVDDDPEFLEYFSLGLRNLGYQVAAAVSDEEAFTCAAAAHFDLAVVDMCLPGSFGAEVAECLQKTWDIPSLFISASDDQGVVDIAIQVGGLGYLVKPVTLSALVAAVEAALARSRDLKKLTQHSHHLEKALASRRCISIAIGITMAQMGLGEAEAFDHLRQLARQRRQKLEAVAEEVVRSLPGSSGEAGSHAR